MALTYRYNGSNPSNLVTSNWWNDYYNLLTGVMTDQEVTIAQSLVLKPLSGPPNIYGSPATAATAITGSALGVGQYYYGFTFVTYDGESTVSNGLPLTTTSGNQAGSLANIPTGPAGTTARKIYRSLVGGGTQYYLATLNDNTTTSYVDSSTDASINGGAQSPTSSMYGGSLLFKDQTGALKFAIANDGTHSKLLVAGTSSLDAGKITTDGNGNLTITGVVYPSSLVSFSTSGTNGLQWRHYSSGYVTDANIFAESGGFLVLQASALGLKTQSGTKLFEVKSTGNMVISGTQYATSSGSVGTASGQSFDGFDVAEVYQCDAPYPSGTVVCPGPNNFLTKCTHDNCPCAMVLSSTPGFLMGECDASSNVAPIALTGRVNVLTSASIAERTLVCSDGQGGVRPVTSGQPAYVLGFTLNASTNGQVGLFLRSLVCTL